MSKKSKKHLLPEALKLIEQGMTRKDTAKQLGICQSTLRNWLNILGMTNKYQKWTPERLQILHSDDKLKNIAKRLGLKDEGTVAYYRHQTKYKLSEPELIIAPFSLTETELLIEEKRKGTTNPLIAHLLKRRLGAVRMRIKYLKHLGINLSKGCTESYKHLLK